MSFIKKKSIIQVCIVSILALVTLFICIGSIFCVNKSAEAFILTNDGKISDTQATNLSELLLDGYEDSGNSKIFNKDVFWQLVSQISGVKNPTKKILETLGETPITSQDIRGFNSDKDVTVIIGGKKWTATYVSRSQVTETHPTSAPILTLWLATSANNKVQSARFTEEATDSCGNYPNNMYGTSELRAKTLNNGGKYALTCNGTPYNATPISTNEWAIYTMTKDDGVKGSITEHLEVPNNMSWQHEQKALDYVKSDTYTNSYGKNNNNDALDYGGNGSKGDYTKNENINAKDYRAWANDKVWLPSVAETGVNGEEGMWELSDNQRSNCYETWTRSGHGGNWWAPYRLSGNGMGIGTYNAGLPLAIRPAIHLNLNSVANNAGALGSEPPADVPTVYTGMPQTFNIDDLGWFDSTRMTISDAPTEMRDAGSYPFKVTITTDDEYDIFTGEPDTSDPNHRESDKVRWFNFIIAKKEIGVVISDDGKTVQEKPGAICSYDVGKEDRLPKFTLSYKTSGGTPLDKYPSATGKNYVATASISNECNYVLDNTYTKVFDVDAKNIDKPTVSGLKSVDYNGAEQGFTINASSDVILTPLDGLRKGDDGKFYAKNVGTYKIRMSLVDDGEVKQWTDLKNTQIREDLEVTIKVATLAITFNGDVWSWNSKTEHTVTFSDSRFGNDKLSFNVSYDSTSINDVTTDHTAKTTTVKIPPLEAKTYALKVSIKPSNDDDSKNYKITGDVAQQSFTVSDKEIEVKESNIKWKYRINNTGSNDVGTWATGTTFSELTYDGRDYSFFVVLEGIDESDGVTATCETKKSGIVVAAGKDAGTYTTTVTLSSDKVKFKNNKNTFTLTWTIDKALFDLSETNWNYTKPLLFNDKDQEVIMTGIPDGLTFTYKNNKKRPVGSYTAEITLITVRSDLKDNYVTPVIPTSGATSSTYKGEVEWKLSWEIKKGELELEWEPKQEKDKNDKVYSCWQSATYADKIDYKYYTVEAYADGALTGAPTDKANIIVPDEEIEIEYYIVAVVKDNTKYEIVGTWAMPFFVGSLATIIDISMAEEFTYDTNPHGKEWHNASVSGMEYVSAQYFKVEEDGSETSLGDTAPTDVGSYVVRLSVDEEYISSYQLSKIKLAYAITKAQIEIELSKGVYDYNGEGRSGEFTVTLGNYDISKILKTYYKGTTKDFPLGKDELPCNFGDYLVVLSLSSEDNGNYEIKSGVEFAIKINKAKITVKWVKDDKGIPSLSGLNETQKEIVGYVYYDADGNELEKDATLELGNSYKVKAILTGNYGDNYQFVAEDGETVLANPVMTDEQDFTVKDSNNGQGGNVGIGSGNSGEVDNSGNQNAAVVGGTLDDILAKFKEMPLWQIIAGIISIILTIIFLSKTASYDKKRKKFSKKADKLTKAYAGAYLGVAMTVWTAIACVLIGLAVISLIMMLIAKSRCDKAEEEYEDRLEEYNRNQKDIDERKRDESMRMMLMGIMGGNAGGQGGSMGGGYVVQQGIGIEDMRGLISETVTALIPNMQQALPQQASSNGELVEKLLEKTAKNEDIMQKLMKKIAEQPTERVVEREVAAGSAISEEALEKIVSKLQPSSNNETILKVVEKTEHNDETIKQLLKNQEILMEKIIDLSNRKPEEKIVEKEIIKEVPVEVEKIVEKEVRVEVPVEVKKVVEKVVEKKVAATVVAPAKSKNETPSKITLDEAYALLSKTQQKYFDGLREYALSKPGCKEKKSTYAITIGQSTVNPLLKLTIKKDMTVALFKMEDEYLKDIKRDASGDGTKIKVKETEVIISDAQACKAAKNMIDLREDQIERYNDLLKEQRAMKRK